MLAAGCGRPQGVSVCSELAISGEACSAVLALQLPAQLPPARGNLVADSPAAAKMGFQIFFDARFSRDQSVRCASCHQPEHSFQDGLARPHATGFVPRKTPTLLNVARQRFQFWDGRADSLWSQAVIPLENPAEMNFTRLEVAHLVQTTYRASYETLFGPMPDVSTLPARGAPGMAAWDSLPAPEKDQVNRIAANIGKSLEAYQRKLAGGPSALDAWLSGDRSALSDERKRGLTVFVAAGCLACHSGPTFSDDKFHNLGVPTLAGETLDSGRTQGLQTLLSSPFNVTGPYSDGPRPPEGDPAYEPDARNEGAIHTPSLRNLLRNEPYGHGGTFSSLEDIVDFHLLGGGRGAAGFAGEVDPLLQPRRLSPEDRRVLLAFLRSLEGTYPQLPWADWPN